MAVIVPVYQFQAKNPWRYYYVKSPSTAGSGWELVGIAFYAFGVKEAETTSGLEAVIQYTAKDPQRYFYALESQSPGAGWTSEGPIFYASKASQTAAPIAIHRYTSAQDPWRYLYAPASKVTAANAPGWKDEGQAFYVPDLVPPDDLGVTL